MLDQEFALGGLSASISAFEQDECSSRACCCVGGHAAAEHSGQVTMIATLAEQSRPTCEPSDARESCRRES